MNPVICVLGGIEMPVVDVKLESSREVAGEVQALNAPKKKHARESSASPLVTSLTSSLRLPPSFIHDSFFDSLFNYPSLTHL